MTEPTCDAVSLDALTDYAAGDAVDGGADALEAHLFSCSTCAARAAEFETLVRETRSAVRAAAVGGFVTDAVLNRLAREGVRVRTFVLSPGAFVPCAVWEDDELMALRLRGDFSAASEFTLSQRIAGAEVRTATAELAAGPHGEVIHVVPAAWIRHLPAVDVEIVLTARDDTGGQCGVARYTLVHGGEARR